MNSKATTIFASTLLTVVGLMVAPVAAQTSDGAAAKDEEAIKTASAAIDVQEDQGWPSDAKKVQLNHADVSARDIVEDICKQSGWGLMWTSPDTGPQIPVLSINDATPGMIVDEILKDSGLAARYSDGTVVVSAVSTRRGSSFDDDFGDDDGDSSDDERVVMGQNLVIAEDEVVGDAVVTGGSMEVYGTVRGDAVVAGGDLYLYPTAVVRGDAVAAGGTLYAKNGARIRGDAVSVGGGLEVEPDVEIGGEQVSIGGAFGSVLEAVIKGTTKFGGSEIKIDGDHGNRVHFEGLPIRQKTAGDHLFRGLLMGLFIFLLGLAFLAVAPGRFHRMSDEITNDPPRTALWTILAFPILVASTIFLMVTVVGIPLAILLWPAAFLVAMLGIAIIAHRFALALPLEIDDATPVKSLAVGAAAFGVLMMIPFGFLRFLIFALFGLLALGIAMRTRFGQAFAVPSANPPTNGGSGGGGGHGDSALSGDVDHALPYDTGTK